MSRVVYKISDHDVTDFIYWIYIRRLQGGRKGDGQVRFSDEGSTRFITPRFEVTGLYCV